MPHGENDIAVMATLPRPGTISCPFLALTDDFQLSTVDCSLVNTRPKERNTHEQKTASLHFTLNQDSTRRLISEPAVAGVNLPAPPLPF